MSLFGLRDEAEAASLPGQGQLPGFDGATGWLNSQPLTAADVRGKVVLVDFGTYSCINWIRTLPYIRAWAEKYADRGLLVVGVQTPEFVFERGVEGVRRALSERGIDYPVAIDNEYTIWSAFDNRYWPALYVADAEGRLRHHHFGEGEYDRSERIIQRLLGAAGAPDVDHEVVSVEARGDEAQPDWGSLETPETYVGFARTQGFAFAGGAVPDESRAYAAPEHLRLNEWALTGRWTIGPEAAMLDEAGGRISCHFHARDLHLVMGSREDGAAVRFRVTVDGHPPGEAHGLDTDDLGNGTVSEPRLYQLIRQPGAIADRTFELTFREAGVAAYVFTFG